MGTAKTIDGLELKVYSWEVDVPKAVILIVPGYGDYGGRYAEFAEHLNTQQIEVHAVDLRGHGESPGQRGYVNRYQDYFLDVDALLKVAEKKSAPVYLFGHSNGGLVVLDYIISGGNGGKVAGVLLSSPFFAIALDVPKAKTIAGRFASRVLPKMSLPSGLSGAVTLRDPDLAASYDTDPLVFKTANARWFTEAMAAKDRVLAGARSLSRPTLVLFAGDDRVASSPAIENFVSRCNPEFVQSEKIQGAFHEILNEPPDVRPRVYQKYADFVLKA